ncbi:MAG TPA: hypothetical protein VFV48_01840 [Pseudomonadales bacterium]|nr:hypothetical protein [Pseudomonadales bacterium]
MNLKTIAATALTLIASSSFVHAAEEKKCGAGSCSKKTQNSDAKKPEASCSKKEASGSTKEASCSKKEASCSKK